MADRFVGLVRVSTGAQEESGLGLQAGRDDIARYVESVEGELVDVLQEVESGKHDRMIKRPILLKALALCKRHRAVLLVPKVDRLVRSTQVHSDIKRSGVSFRACDNPHANEFTLDILVAVAAQEARAISDRTAKALRAYKDHGKISRIQMAALVLRYGKDIPPEALAAVAGKLGSHLTHSRLTPEQQARGRAEANASSRRKSIDTYDDLIPEIKLWRSEAATLQAIADRLNERGERRLGGARWSKVQVKRLLDRTKAG